MRKTHKYRLYPNKTQEQELQKWMRIACDVYCILVDYKARLWETSGRHASERDLKEMFQLIRQVDTEINEPVQGIFYQMIRFKIMPAYKSFFKLIRKYKDDKDSLTGRPQTIDIKSHNGWAIIKRNRYEAGDREIAKDLPKRHFDSLQFGAEPNNMHAWIDGKKLYLGTERKFKSGGIKIRLHRPIDGDLRTIVVKREYGKWYACCSIECNAPKFKVAKKPRETGIDMGVKHLVTTSDGKHYSSIEAYNAKAEKLDTLYSMRSRKQYGSRSSRKVSREIGRTWEYIRSKRKTLIDQVIHDLIESYDVVYHEDLDIAGLLSRKDEHGKRKRLNKRLSDQTWGNLLKRLNEKVNGHLDKENGTWTGGIAGKKVVAVPAHYTSQMCSSCFSIDPSMSDMRKRTYRCKHCGLVLDRDVNAARNVLNFGRNEFGLFLASERWKERHEQAAD